MARLTGRALKDDIANTVIEDSEPERQAEEARRKEERRRRRAISKAQKEDAKQKRRTLPEVTVISDSNVTLPSIQQGVIEVNGIGTDLNESVVGQSSPQPSRLAIHDFSSPSEELKSTHPSHVKPLVSSQDVSSNEHNPPINLAACITTTAYPDSPTPKLNLSRFAFTQRAGPSTKLKPGDIKTAFTSAQKMPRNPKTAPDLPLADIFTTSQLSSLSKCVVCELAWTTRKTVPVKMLHIKRCASKNAWTKETVILAITEAMNNMPAPPAKELKAKDKEQAVSEVETHLEHLVNGVAPKKRRKKVQDPHVVTVLHPQDAHAAIIKRTNAIFGGTTVPSSSGLLQSDPSAFPSTQPFGPSKLMTSNARGGVLGTGMLEDQTSPSPTVENAGSEQCRDTDPRPNGVVPPSTQPSQANALGSTFTKLSIFSHEDRIASEALNNEDQAEMPLPTQRFGESALAGRFRKPKRSVFNGDHGDCEDENWAVTEPVQLVRNPVCLHNSIISPQNPQLTPCRQHAPGTPSTSYSANEEHLYLPTTAQTKLTNLERRLERLHKDIAFYPRQQEVEDHYPSVSKLVKARAQVEQEKEDAGGDRSGSIKIHKARSSPLSTSKSSSRSRSRSRSHSRKPRRRKSRSPFKYGEGMDVTHKYQYDDTLDQELHRIITEDEVLYMRILRYEPINFDIFLKVASQHGMDGRGFRLKLRAFLDRHAINFYGDNALTSNRRRYK